MFFNELITLKKRKIVAASIAVTIFFCLKVILSFTDGLGVNPNKDYEVHGQEDEQTAYAMPRFQRTNYPK